LSDIILASKPLVTHLQGTHAFPRARWLGISLAMSNEYRYSATGHCGMANLYSFTSFIAILRISSVGLPYELSEEDFAFDSERLIVSSKMENNFRQQYPQCREGVRG
jgi:hypothetical protein